MKFSARYLEHKGEYSDWRRVGKNRFECYLNAGQALEHVRHLTRHAKSLLDVGNLKDRIVTIVHDALYVGVNGDMCHGLYTPGGFEECILDDHAYECLFFATDDESLWEDVLTPVRDLGVHYGDPGTKEEQDAAAPPLRLLNGRSVFDDDEDESDYFPIPTSNPVERSSNEPPGCLAASARSTPDVSQEERDGKEGVAPESHAGENEPESVRSLIGASKDIRKTLEAFFDDGLDDWVCPTDLSKVSQDSARDEDEGTKKEQEAATPDLPNDTFDCDASLQNFDIVEDSDRCPTSNPGTSESGRDEPHSRSVGNGTTAPAAPQDEELGKGNTKSQDGEHGR